MKKNIYNLRELREAENLSLQELAKQTNIPYSTVQAIESGRGKNFNIITKHRIADYFHVPLLSLFPEEKEKYEMIMGGVDERKKAR